MRVSLVKMPTQADVVLSILQMLMGGVDRDIAGYVTVSSYENGREHGHAIVIHAKATTGELAQRQVSFAENRNSDDIVVYYGHPAGFAYNTNIPDAQVYNSQAKYFKYRDFNGAADFIIDYLFKDIP